MSEKSRKPPRTVEGVDTEAASVAKTAAQAAGLSVSNWLSKVILESTGSKSAPKQGPEAAPAPAEQEGSEEAAPDTAENGDQFDQRKESLEQFLQAVIDESSAEGGDAETEPLGAVQSWPQDEEDSVSTVHPSVEITRESMVMPQGAIVFETNRADREDPAVAAKVVPIDTPVHTRQPRPMEPAPFASPSNADMEDNEIPFFDENGRVTLAYDGGASMPAPEPPPQAQSPETPVEPPPAALEDSAEPAPDGAPTAPDSDPISIPPAFGKEPDATETAPGEIGGPDATDTAEIGEPDATETAEIDQPAIPAEPETATTETAASTEAPAVEIQEDEAFDILDLQLAEAEGLMSEARIGATVADSETLGAAAPASPEVPAQPERSETADHNAAGAADELTWWERLEAQDAAQTSRPEAVRDKTAIDSDDLDAIRAIVAGEDGDAPVRRSGWRWASAIVVLAVAGLAFLAWRYPAQFQELRQRAATVIAGQLEGPLPGQDTARQDAPAERLPLEDEPSETAKAPPSQDKAAPDWAGARYEDPPAGPPEQNLTWYQRAAQSGNPAAQVTLARLYADGDGVSQDFGEAARWYRLAAAAGLADAQYGLGTLFEEGRGVAQDTVEAVVWYELASRQDHALAQYKLGMAHLNGIGTPINPTRARLWFERAARQGVPAAKHELGLIYRDGLGVPKQNALAFKWLSEAGEQGHAPSVAALRVLMPEISGKDLIAAGELIKDPDGKKAAKKEAPAAANPPQEAAVQRSVGPDNPDDAVIGPAMPDSMPAPSGFSTPPAASAEPAASAAPALPPAPAKSAAPATSGPAPTDGPKSKTIIVADPALVAEIQLLLRRLNLKTGNTQGQMDPVTRKAILNYQQIAGLTPDGQPSEALRAHLRAVLAGSGNN